MLRVTQSTTMSPTGSRRGSPVRFSNTVTMTRPLDATEGRGRANHAPATTTITTAAALTKGHQERLGSSTATGIVGVEAVGAVDPVLAGGAGGAGGAVRKRSTSARASLLGSTSRSAANRRANASYTRSA